MLVYRPARLGLLLAAALSVGVGSAAPETKRSEPASSQSFPPPDARSGPGGTDSPEVKALLRQRRGVLEAELSLARKTMADPNFRPDVWSALAERLLLAASDAAETPAERV